ncbi:kinase-like domain-containing protein [Gigaspora rosea]|uniref:Kinase-like domain-containing protein n=1 Tax=Gigaspora rosea TaxID=44941 RepID=A0A397VE13_9GLOM|nr:kinase-like domain-containing protein [Gigaspora rosea]
MIEWIPFNRLVNWQKIREEESEAVFMATWLDGKRILETIENDLFKKKLIYYMQLEGDVVYGISQNTETKEYIIVIPDKKAPYEKCTQCGQSNALPSWCQYCDLLETTQKWTSGNSVINDLIKDFQMKAKKAIVWIPYDILNNFPMDKEEESGTISMATSLDGIRIIKNELTKYIQSRIESCGVNLKILHNSQKSEFFIEKLTNYMKVEGNILYGISQDEKTKEYIMVIPDEFSSRRNASNGECEHCKKCNTSPAWCQSCDPLKITQEWTSGNEMIDNFIKYFQIKAEKYEKVIEWIPFDKLINLRKFKEFDLEINKESDAEIKESDQEFKISDLVFMATWSSGIRKIEGVSEKYTRSRKISTVELMKLHCTQISDLNLEKFKNYIEKYKIHGLTQNTENQYMIAIDFFNDERKPINGICIHCERDNTNPAWCQLCDHSIITQETSGDKDIDKCIKEFQLKSTTYEKVIEWIPFNMLENIETIGKGGFGTVYSAVWLDGKRIIEGNNDVGYARSRKRCKVALKTLSSPQTSSNFLTEFQNHMQCRLGGSELEIYGLTQNENKDYLMVLQYAIRGNLHEFLQQNFRDSNFTWKEKLEQLKDISHDLNRIHLKRWNQTLSGKIKSYIADLGLSRKKDDNSKVIFGVMPYVAPEVLSGQQLTSAADIYGFGVIMSEMSTGQRPFNGYPFVKSLAFKICNGLRPEFASGTPSCYIELAKKCMDFDLKERPNAEQVYDKLQEWIKCIEDSVDNEIKKQFLDADKKEVETLQINLHPGSMYTSKMINTQNIQKILSATKVSIPVDVIEINE